MLVEKKINTSNGQRVAITDNDSVNLFVATKMQPNLKEGMFQNKLYSPTTAIPTQKAQQRTLLHCMTTL